MYLVKITFKDKPILEFTSDLDFQNIIEILYMKYGVEASYLKDIMFIGDDDISKASHNIINLIEVGDYVNGCYIQEIKSLKDNVMVCMLDSDYEFVSTITNKEIKSIVTKEMFSSMEYRLGDDK